MAEKKSILVVGLGRFGRSVCERLHELKQYVIGVDKSLPRVEEMVNKLSLSAQLDATEEEALIKVGAKEVDVAVVAIGEGIEASVLATAILKDFNIPLIIARAIDPLHGRVLSRVGAHIVISPEHERGLAVAEELVYPWLSSFSHVASSDLLVGEIPPLPEMAGKNLSDLKFTSRYHAIVLLIERDGQQFIPRADTVILPSDKLWIAGKQEDLASWIPSTPFRKGAIQYE